MAFVNFVQYLRPDGRRVIQQIDRPEHIAKAADLITAHGFRLAMELLMDNVTVSLTIEDEERDYHIALTLNGPSVAEAVDTLISTFDLAAAIKLRKQNAH